MTEEKVPGSNNNNNNNNTVTRGLEARIVEDGKTSIARLQQLKQPAVARQWLRKHVSLATDMYAYHATPSIRNSWH
jgi:hypothetical protein